MLTLTTTLLYINLTLKVNILIMALHSDHLSSQELADLLGISHVAVYKKIKKGQLKAKKVGRNYVIDAGDVSDLVAGKFTEKMRNEIETAVAKVVKEYGETLKLLGRE